MKRIEAADMKPLLEDLNEEQRSAVCHLNGPMLVLAGAGTGKTRVIITRIANLLAHGVDPKSIVAVSFTRKAGDEMKGRLDGLLGGAAEGMRCSTFHSLGLHILREQHGLAGLKKSFGVCNAKKQREVCEDILGSLGPEHVADGDFDDTNVRHLVRRISLAKNIGQTADALVESDSRDDRLTGLVLRAYDEELQRLQLIDLDDMVRLPVQILESNATARRLYQQRYSHVLVDEYQDSNVLQNRLMRCLLGKQKNICVVGDDDQSIYGFRGAERQLILQFEDEYPGAKVVKLTANYRCSREIIGVANEVIADSPDRYAKELVAANGSAAPVRFMEISDALNERRFIASDIRATQKRERRPFSDFAVLVRVSQDAKAIRDELKRNSLPCGRKESGINVMTLHASKGLEFPVVYLPGVEEGNLPHRNATSTGELSVDEERRLFYVGVTRAEKRLTLSSSLQRGRHARRPSRFAAGLIEKQLVEHQELLN